MTTAEIDNDQIKVGPDLAALAMLLESSPFDRLDGQSFHLEFGDDDDEALQLSLGTLAGRAAGTLIGLRVRQTGLHLEDVGAVVEPPFDIRAEVKPLFAPDPELIEDWDSGYPADGPIGLAELIHHLCIQHPKLFLDPALPLGELLEQWELDRDGDVVAPVGADFGPSDDDLEVFDIARIFGISALHALAVMQFNSRVTLAEKALRDWQADGRNGSSPRVELTDLIALTPMLVDPAVAVAVFTRSVNSDPSRAGVLLPIIKTLQTHAHRRVQPALQWLLARCLDLLGSVAEAEAAYEKATSLDPHFEPALRDLAAFAAEHGDARRAAGLLHRAGAAPDDPSLAMVERFVGDEHPGIGRNSPCWCGSGRKYKICHLGKSSYSLTDRRDWLYQKVARWIQDGIGRILMLELGYIRSEFWDRNSALADALADPLTLDVAMFEGGGLDDFIRIRGTLLPDDEQLLAASWLTNQRSLFEVEEVRRGVGFTLRDLRTGDRHQVTEKLGSLQAKVGTLLCTRLLGVDGSDVGIYGGIEPVPRHLQEATLAMLDRQGTDDLGPYQTMRVLTARFAPPEMRTAEGDPLVLCKAVVAVPAADRDTLADALTASFGAEENGWTWTTAAEIGERILGSVRRADDDWEVNCTSERRFLDVLDIMRNAVPGLTISSEERTSAMELFRASDSNGDRASTLAAPELDDPEVATVLLDFIEKYEQKWLDDRIPALGGATPREASNDPTRRQDLIKLLNDLADMPAGAVTMNAGRLRAALALSIDA